MPLITLPSLLILVSGLAAAEPPPGIPAPPGVNARSYVVIDFDSGAVLAEKHADERAEPASLAKIMTVYVTGAALQSSAIALSDEVTVSEKAWRMGGSRMFIEVGKKVTVDDLLQGIIIQSGNDASIALAEHVSGSEEAFAAAMNQHAQRLGMVNTHFSNSTGFPDPATYTTARDMALLSAALIRDYPDLYGRFAEPEYTYNGIRQFNRNRLLARDASVDGVKTGHTEAAGYCLAAAAVRDGRRLISVVMGADSDSGRNEASQALLGYGFRFFETRRLYKAYDQIASARVWKGEENEIPVGLTHDLFVTVPTGRSDKLDTVAVVDKSITAPVGQHQAVGSVRVMLGDTELRSVPLVALEAVAEGAWYERFWDAVLLLFE